MFKSLLKKLSIILTVFIWSPNFLAQSTINFFGINGWYPTSQGGQLNAIMSANILTNSNAELRSKMIRIGGTFYDQNNVTAASVGNIVTPAQGKSMTPIVQIPGLAIWMANYWDNINNYASMTAVLTDPVNGVLKKTGAGSFHDQCSTFVNTLKNTYGVHYWSIANEPDNYSTHNSLITNINNPTPFYDLKNSGDEVIIALYIKTIANWVRGWDPSATIFGPDFTWHHFNLSSPGNGLLEKLSDASNPSEDIWVSSSGHLGHIDVFSFHYYAEDPNAGWSKQDLINDPYINSNSLDAALTGIQTWLTANGSYPYAKLGITEFNVSWENDHNNSNGIYDESANSFIAGQFFAELLAVGRYHRNYLYNVTYMIPWSVQEGVNLGATDLGLINWGGGSNDPYEKRSTYHHLRMMAQEFWNGRVEIWNTSSNNIKAFAVRSCTGAAVMVMNQNYNTGNNHSYRFNLDGTAVTSGETIHGNINMEWDGRYVSSSMTHNLGLIGDLQTHLYILDFCGNVQYSYYYSAAINNTSYNPPSEVSYGAQAGCHCNLADETGEWYYQGEIPYRPYMVNVNNEDPLDKISVYPNPANENIHLSRNSNKTALFTLIDIKGETVLTTTLAEGTYEFDVPLEQLESGVYFYSLIEEQKPTSYRKLIIIK